MLYYPTLLMKCCRNGNSTMVIQLSTGGTVDSDTTDAVTML
jgi:hypothetical protein